MILIGARVIVLGYSLGQQQQQPEWKCGYIRASTEPLERLTDLLKKDIQVCIQYDRSDSYQFSSLLDSSRVQAVYIEDCLIWAKRLLPQRPLGVAWPARAFKLLIGQAAHKAGTLLIEYLLDVEQTIVPLSQIKEFTMDVAKDTLTGHLHLLSCLEQVEAERRFQTMLVTGGLWLVGQEVEVFRCFTRPWFSAMVRDQNPSTGELTILDSNVLMPYRVEYRKVQVKLPEGVRLDDVLNIQSSTQRRPSSRRSSMTGPLAPIPVSNDNCISELGAWSMTDIAESSSSQGPALPNRLPGNGAENGPPRGSPATSPSDRVAAVLGGGAGRFRVPGPLEDRGNEPSNGSLPAPMFPGEGALHPRPLYQDKRHMSMIDIHRIGSSAGSLPFHHSSQHKPVLHPFFLPPPTGGGVGGGSSSSSLMRSASQPVLNVPAGPHNLEHILSIISRDPSVQDLSQAPPPEGHAPSEGGGALLRKTSSGGSLLEEDEGGYPPHRGGPPSLPYEDEDLRSALAAKSMPMLHRPAPAHRLLGPPAGLDFHHHHHQDFAAVGDQTLRNPSSNFAMDTHPLAMCRGFQSEINLAKPSIHDRDYLDYLRDGRLYPTSRSMTSLLSSDYDSDDSHEDRVINGEFPGKRQLSGRETNPQAKRRGRGRPRLTEEEKQRRKELRDRGLMRKNKKRRTRDEMLRDKMERQQNPKQRGRKKGCKRGTVKDINGLLINLGDLQEGDHMLQVAPCCSFVGVGPCQECWPNKMSTHQNCRFVEFRRLKVVEVSEETVRWETAGFAGPDDVKPEHLAHWIPLKTGYSGVDETAGNTMLRHIAQLFLDIVARERSVYEQLGGKDTTWSWKRAVGGVRELCDVCYTTLFNYHFVCSNCGFAVCLDCHKDSTNRSDDDSEQSDWPQCATCGGQPHFPQQLLPTYIIPNDILWELTESIIHACPAGGIPLQIPPQLSDLGTQNNGGSSSSKSRDLQLLPKGFDEEGLGVGALSEGTHMAPCAWLCEGRLLQLLNPTHHENTKVFESKWILGEPVLISNVQDCLNQLLWTPQAFSRDFGTERVDLVDCRTGLILPDIPAHQFWMGFENVQSRLRDQATEETMLLKLKDWPTAEDFSEKLPRRFEDIMQGLPLGDYTKRDGKLNIVSSLPSHFVKPDMGPKMYIAYGSPYYPSLGTTNLHLDMSDAVNVLVFANSAEPSGMFEPEDEQILECVRQECCPAAVDRIQHSALRVGAIWHIFHASDADKMRQFIRKVQMERGIHSFPGSDPIHDQRIYLTLELRRRLEQELGVRAWSIAQCVGDAVFIPAGAPHQVRNICSCIKIAEDFVSPQHVPECLKLTEEFRHLSDLHNNHEDKLQMKNIIYHTMKDVVGAQQASKATAST